MAKQSQLDKAIAVFEMQRAEHLRHAEILAEIIAELRGQRPAKAAKPRAKRSRREDGTPIVREEA